MLAVGKKYSSIKTDIPFSRGLNGVGFVEYKNATVLEEADGAFKIAYEVQNGAYIKVAYVFKQSVKSALPYERTFKCQIKKGNAYFDAELTEEESELNRKGGRIVIERG